MKSVQNIYSYHLIVELEALQHSGRYIHEQMYIIAFPSSLVPVTIITWNSIPPEVRQASTIGQFQAGLESITLPVQSQV